MKRKPSKKRSEWQQIILDYQQSGQSVESYCATKNVTPKSLNKWRSLFDLESKAEKFGPQKNFLRIKTQAPTSAPQSETIDCHLANGIRIEWPASLNTANLLSLLRGLS